MSPVRDGPACLAGIALKVTHARELVDRVAPRESGAVDFVEVHAENYMVDGGPMVRLLHRVRERWPLSIHGVGLSIGGEGPLDRQHLDRLATLLQRFEPRWFSEHLAWSGHGGRWFNDLLPLPYDLVTLHRVCDHVDQVQARLRRALLLENPSTYVEYACSTMSEGQFLAEVVRRTGCGLLLDVGNAYVSAVNHGQDAWALIEMLPAHAIGEIHLAGFSEDRDAVGDRLLIDHHGAPVDAAVWALYERTIARLGPVPTLIERDNHLPPLATLESEARRAASIQRRAGRAAAPPPGASAAQATLARASMPSRRSPIATSAPTPQRFAEALLDPTRPPPAGLVAWNGSDVATRFAVHRNNVVHSLVSVLGDTFPVVRQMVGDAFFNAMARVYVAERPPRSPLMHRYGDGFACWLEGFEPAAALTCLSDLARLEFARVVAFHAADVAPIDPQVLVRALDDPERLASTSLVLHPSLTVVRSAHAVVSLWSAHQHDDAQRDARLARLDLDAAEAAVVLRQGDDALVIELPPADAALADAWSAGRALGAVQGHDPAADVTRLLTLLLTHGAVVDLSAALDAL